MARITKGSPLFKLVGTQWKSAGNAEKTLNVTLLAHKPYDLICRFDLDGEKYRVNREYVTSEPELHPDDKTIDRGALGAAGGTEGDQGQPLSDKDAVGLDDLDKTSREGTEGTPHPENEGSYPGDGETNPPTNEEFEATKEDDK